MTLFKNIKIKWISQILIMLFISAPCFSKDLGVVGDTYPIQEEDFLEFLQRRLQGIQQNSQWETLKQTAQDKIAKHADRPKPNYLPRAMTTKSWDYDPSITVPYDLKDDKGNFFCESWNKG